MQERGELGCFSLTEKLAGVRIRPFYENRFLEIDTSIL